MTTLNLNCACDPCVTSYYRISTESHDCCNLIGSANIPAEPTETCSESADPLSLSLSSPLARPLVFRSSPVKRARRVCPGRLPLSLQSGSGNETSLWQWPPPPPPTFCMLSSATPPLIYYSHAKASTAKQTNLCSLLGLELKLYCVLISSSFRHPWRVALSTGPQRHRVTRPQSSSNERTIQISFPDDNVTDSGRIGFILGVWVPLGIIIGKREAMQPRT